MTKVVDDGVIRQRMGVEDGKLVLEQGNNRAHVQAVRDSAKRLRGEDLHRSDIRLHLTMTEQDFARISDLYPDVHSPDREVRRRTWERVAKAFPEIVAKPFTNKFARG